MTKAPTVETRSKSPACTAAPLNRRATGPRGDNPRKSALPSGALSFCCSGIQTDPTGVRRAFQELARRSKAQSAASFFQLLRALGKVGEGDPFDVAQNLTGVDEARGATGRQVHLSDVPGNHRLAVEAQPGEEHLHLLDGGVLGLVENDERVVERAAAHEGKRRHLDRALIQEVSSTIAVQHVVQSIVERAQIGVYLLGQVTR